VGCSSRASAPGESLLWLVGKNVGMGDWGMGFPGVSVILFADKVLAIIGVAYP
jgi:hypothetical protein